MKSEKYQQYILKSALVAEIDKRKIGYNTDGNHTVEYNTVKKILDILDTLEVKEVDLEEEICTFFSKNPIPYEHITDWPLLKNCAIHFFELGLNTAQKGSYAKR